MVLRPSKLRSKSILEGLGSGGTAEGTAVNTGLVCGHIIADRAY